MMPLGIGLQIFEPSFLANRNRQSEPMGNKELDLAIKLNYNLSSDKALREDMPRFLSQC